MYWSVYCMFDGFDVKREFEFGDLKGLKDYLRSQKLSYVPGMFALLGHFEKTKEPVSLFFEDNGVPYVVEMTKMREEVVDNG